MYQVVVFLHVLSVLIFMFLHGVSAVVLFVIARQENPEQVRALLALRRSVSPVVVVFSILILLTGIIAASMGNWWEMGWTRASLLLFIGIAVVMTTFGRRYYDRLSRLLNAAPGSSTLSGELTAQLRKAPRGLLMVIGLGGVGVILWLMLFKPF